MLKIVIVGSSLCAEEFIRMMNEPNTNSMNINFIGQWIPEDLPEIIDDFVEIKIPEFVLSADIILDYSKHPDMLFLLKDAKKIITTTKCNAKNVLFADCFCAINITEKLGVPEFKVIVEKGTIKDIEVLRSSPCGAAFIISKKLKHKRSEDALKDVGVLTQYLCKGKGGPDSSIHKAAEIHKNALEMAMMKINMERKKKGKDDTTS